MPVGRYVLDLHGETARPATALRTRCASSLQVLNHLQDCARDLREARPLLPAADLLAQSRRDRGRPSAPRPKRRRCGAFSITLLDRVRRG